VLVAFLPLVLLTAVVGGYLLDGRLGFGGADVVAVVLRYLPEGSEVGVHEVVDRILAGLIADRTSYSLVGLALLAWISTRLVATLRVVLRLVFQAKESRGLIRGKLFDLAVVFVGGGLILLNFGLTVATRFMETLGVSIYGLGLVSAWVLFFLLYRFVPPRRVGFRVAVAGATFATVGFEVLKQVFAWYVTSVADFSNAYGSLAVAAVLFFWVYYSSIVFVLGALLSRTLESIVRPHFPSDTDTGPDTGPDMDTGTAAVAATVAAPTTRAAAAPASAVMFLIAALFCAAPGSAQSPLALFGGNGASPGLLDGGDGVVYGTRILERELELEAPLIEHDGPYVVVHLEENRVFVMEGNRVRWSAPAGTGTGFQLEGDGRSWTFTTPVGLFQVLRKEKDPIWIAPDWHFVQRGQPVPAFDHPSRYIRGTLGTSALYLGDGIAIHGTDRPQLLLNPDPAARRVSAGCIRLTNEAARQLYHMVQVGTPVLIF
jgi:YihY family inner membrane protein